MASTDISLRFAFPGPESHSDIRTFRVYRDDVELYRFYHPMTGLQSETTTFHRQNLNTQIFETAGEIYWSSQYNATLRFGIEEVPLRDLRQAKKSTSKSRRFKASGSEYKWKIADDGIDLFCVDSRGNTIVNWSSQHSVLLVSSRVEPILDRIVVTFVLNLWFKQLECW